MAIEKRTDRMRLWFRQLHAGLLNLMPRGRVPAGSLVIMLACVIGVAGGYGAVLFTLLIHAITNLAIEPVLHLSEQREVFSLLLIAIPAVGLVFVAWFTRRYAPEAQGHGVPEVITAVARHDGIIRPRVSLIKIIASAFCIGTGGSVGREGPIVQIGSSLGSSAGQFFKLSAENIKVLVACGAAAGISATFNAPLAGVMFASEIILGSFAVRSLTPIVVASVLADVIQLQSGEHGLAPAFRQLNYQYLGHFSELPFYFILGLTCGLAAVSFTKVLYLLEDVFERRLSNWWLRALLAGLVLGAVGAIYPSIPPSQSNAEKAELRIKGPPPPPVFGVGYRVVEHTLHMENKDIKTAGPARQMGTEADKRLRLSRDMMLQQLWWLLPLLFLKPLLTSTTLAGGGSGGIFAPSLFLGAVVGSCFGLLVNLFVPGLQVHPGIYAVVGMGAVVAGTTHGPLSAILIVYEMTGDYRIILPIMIAAGLASIIATWIDPESIYQKKLSRRGESVTRGHHLVGLEHVKVRELMLRQFPVIKHDAQLTEIIAIAKEHTDMESFPVVDEKGQLQGLIRPEDIHQLLESQIPPHLLLAHDLALHSPLSVSPDENLLEALADFGSRDVETLPVEKKNGPNRQLIGILQRSQVMQRYRKELLQK